MVDSTKAGGTTYTVKKGDCLRDIAQKVYSNCAKYGIIIDANRDALKRPHFIYPGQVLTIPPL